MKVINLFALADVYDDIPAGVEIDLPDEIARARIAAGLAAPVGASTAWAAKVEADQNPDVAVPPLDAQEIVAAEPPAKVEKPTKPVKPAR